MVVGEAEWVDLVLNVAAIVEASNVGACQGVRTHVGVKGGHSNAGGALEVAAVPVVRSAFDLSPFSFGCHGTVSKQILQQWMDSSCHRG